MDLKQVSQALSNPTRLNLIRIIQENPCSAAEAHRRYVETYEDKKRESIYRELENLVEASLLIKDYNNEEKEIQYRLSHRMLRVNLETLDIKPIEEEEI
jgi:Fe2+ or Zn2+ uptake regulation protein